MQFLALAGSVCRWQFVGVLIGVLDVKLLIVMLKARIEVLKVYRAP